MTKQKPNQRIHLLITIIAPTVILSQLSGDDALGQVRSVIVAFALPLGYGIWDRYVRRDWDLLAGLGMLSVLLTGGIALLELPAQYLVIKEAAIPLLIGIIVAISILMGQSLIDKLLWTVIDQETLNSRVSDQRHQVESAFRTVGRWFVGSFVFSSVLNRIITSIIVTAEPGTELFNQQLGSNTIWNFIGIALPSMIMLMVVLWRLLQRLEKISGLTLEELIVAK